MYVQIVNIPQPLIPFFNFVNIVNIPQSHRQVLIFHPIFSFSSMSFTVSKKQ